MAPHRPEDEAGRRAQNISWAAVNHLLRSGFSWSGHERNNAYVNLGDGSFSDVSFLCGVSFADDARGVAPVDWDDDGDLDLWINNRSSPKARLLRNDHLDAGHRLDLRLVGAETNRDAVGARVEMDLPGGRSLIRTVRAGVNYTVQGSKRLHFGLGDLTAVEGLTVRWPDGSTSRHEVPAVDRTWVVSQGESELTELTPPRAASGLRAAEYSVPPHSRTASVPLGTPLELPSEMGMEDFEGRRHRFSDSSGRPVLINLWASWCAPCRGEFEEFDKHRLKLLDQELKILACSVDEDPQAAAAAAEELGLWFPSGMCDANFLGLVEVIKKVVFDQYEELLLPTSLLLDGQGRLARIYVGPADMEALADDVDKLRSAATDLEVLRLASVYPQGRWERAGEWIVSQRGNRLVAMTEFLVQGDLSELTQFYAGRLASYMREQRPPERTMLTATDTLMSAAGSLRDENPAAAAELFRQVLHHRPQHALASLGLAETLLEVGGTAAEAEAQSAFETMLAQMPEAGGKDQDGVRGLVLQRLGRPEEALPYLERAVANDGSNPRTREALGSALVELGRPSEAIEHLEAVTQAFPEDPTPELALATALDLAGRQAEATPHFERFIELSLSASEVDDRMRLASAHFRLRQFEEAIPHLTDVIAETPDSPQARRLLGLALAQVGRDAEAREQLETALAEVQPTANDAYMLGLVQARTGSLAAAVESFETALSLDPASLATRLSLARALERSGQLDEAIGHYRRYVDSVPEDTSTLGRLGGTLEGAGRTGEAINAYRTLLQRNPGDNVAKHRLAWLLATSPRAEERDGETAVRLAKEVLAETGPQPQVLDLMAAAHAEAGQFDEAIAAAAEARRLATELGATEVADKIGMRLELYQSSKPYRSAT